MNRTVAGIGVAAALLAACNRPDADGNADTVAVSGGVEARSDGLPIRGGPHGPPPPQFTSAEGLGEAIRGSSLTQSVKDCKRDHLRVYRQAEAKLRTTEGATPKNEDSVGSLTKDQISKRLVPYLKYIEQGVYKGENIVGVYPGKGAFPEVGQLPGACTG